MNELEKKNPGEVEYLQAGFPVYRVPEVRFQFRQTVLQYNLI